MLPLTEMPGGVDSNCVEVEGEVLLTPENLH